MVAIARALMSDPRLVIFDELSLGLAPAIIDQIYVAIEQIRSWQISIVLIEQNAYRALAVADRATCWSEGACHYVGAPEELEGRASAPGRLLRRPRADRNSPQGAGNRRR
jgi:branched-chain amino acid transport system ATP-binding protein